MGDGEARAKATRGLRGAWVRMIWAAALGLASGCVSAPALSEEAALGDVGEAFAHAYRRDVWAAEAAPDWEVQTVTPDSIVVSREGRSLTLRYRDVVSVEWEGEDFPGEDRVTARISFERESPTARSAAQLAEEDPVRRLLFAPGLTLPGRTRWQGIRLKRALVFLRDRAVQRAQSAAEGRPPGVHLVGEDGPGSEAAPRIQNEVGAANLAAPPLARPPLKERLRELRDAYHEGLLSEEEYEAQKARILGEL